MQVAYKLKEGMPFNLSTSNEIAVANGKDIYFHNTLSGKQVMIRQLTFWK